MQPPFSTKHHNHYKKALNIVLRSIPQCRHQEGAQSTWSQRRVFLCALSNALKQNPELKKKIRGRICLGEEAVPCGLAHWQMSKLTTLKCLESTWRFVAELRLPRAGKCDNGAACCLRVDQNAES